MCPLETADDIFHDFGLKFLFLFFSPFPSNGLVRLLALLQRSQTKISHEQQTRDVATHHANRREQSGHARRKDSPVTTGKLPITFLLQYRYHEFVRTVQIDRRVKNAIQVI